MPKASEFYRWLSIMDGNLGMTVEVIPRPKDLPDLDDQVAFIPLISMAGANTLLSLLKD